MGKIRRKRSKLHLESAKSKLPQASDDIVEGVSTPTGSDFLIKPQENLFAGLNINMDNIKKSLNDDTRSVKSSKSVKFEAVKIIPKKDKLKMRREMLIKKFEVMAKEKQVKKSKKKSGAVVGDLNSLRDALPSLENLLKSRGTTAVPFRETNQPKKKRGIEKANKIKKNHLQGIKMFQLILKNKQYQKNPKDTISRNVKALLHTEQNK